LDDLISKKEVLQTYGISYGALYRWKRMGLIPEDWFLRKSTSTGQETFFRRGQICPRVELILAREQGISLEELAEQLSRKEETPRKPRTLILEDRFGVRSFDLSDLRQARISDGTQEVSILEYLQKFTL
jgi:DNA-binding transcriptional MerR regulator